MVGTRSLSSGAHSRDPLALPTLRTGANSVLHHAHRAARGAARERRIGLQCDRDFSRALGGLPRFDALGFHRMAPLRQFGLVDREMDRARRDVDLDAVAVLYEADQAA